MCLPPTVRHADSGDGFRLGDALGLGHSAMALGELVLLAAYRVAAAFGFSGGFAQ